MMRRLREWLMVPTVSAAWPLEPDGPGELDVVGVPGAPEGPVSKDIHEISVNEWGDCYLPEIAATCISSASYFALRSWRSDLSVWISLFRK